MSRSTASVPARSQSYRRAWAVVAALAVVAGALVAGPAHAATGPAGPVHAAMAPAAGSIIAGKNLTIKNRATGQNLALNYAGLNGGITIIPVPPETVGRKGGGGRVAPGTVLLQLPGGSCAMYPDQSSKAATQPSFWNVSSCDVTDNSLWWAFVPEGINGSPTDTTSGDFRVVRTGGAAVPTGEPVAGCLTFDTLTHGGGHSFEGSCAGGADLLFTVSDDERDSTGAWVQWSYILGAGIAYAISSCDYWGGCEVRSPGTGDQWVSSQDPAALAGGTLVTRSLGCGIPAGGVTRAQNSTSSPISVAVSSTGTSSVSHQESTGYTRSWDISALFGKKDVWSATAKYNGTVSGQKVDTNTNTTTETYSKTVTIQPGESYMYTWSQQAYQVTAEWRFTPPLYDGTQGGRSAGIWTLPETTLFPATVNGTAPLIGTDVTSSSPKDCDASPASVDVSTPTIAASREACATADPPAPATAVGTTLYACPGTWDIAPDNRNERTPRFQYQWYYLDAAQTPHPISGAVQDTFALTNYSFDFPRIGVKVQETDTTGRLDSAWAETAAPIELVLPSSGAPVIAASRTACADAHPARPTAAADVTVYACASPGNPDAPASAYRYQWYYLDSALAAHDITGAVADEFTLSDFSFEYRYLGVKTKTADTAWVPTTAPLKLVSPLGAAAEPARVAGALPAAALGLPYADSVLRSDDGVLARPAPGQSLALTAGSLPAGLSFDPASGAVTGTPTAEGTATFTVSSTFDGETLSQDYTVIAFGQAGFRALGADARTIDVVVGGALSVPVVDAPGAATLALVDGALPDGLVLDPDGELTGVPARAGAFTVTLRYGDEDTTADLASYTVRVRGTDTVYAAAAPALTVGTPFSVSLATPGSDALLGLPSDRAALDAGFADLVLDSVSGTLTGTPTREGTYTVRIGDLTRPDAATGSVILVVGPRPAAAATGSAGRAGDLAATGGDAATSVGIGMAGVLLMLAGAVVLVARRRRA